MGHLYEINSKPPRTRHRSQNQPGASWRTYNRKFKEEILPAAVDQVILDKQATLLEELKEFLRIPSVSTLPEHNRDVACAAEFVASKLKSAGLENVALIRTDKHPLVYADWLHAPGKPTVLCYGHYDVQPPDPLELWVTPPFEPSERDGNLYARGACDDKGQMYMHIKAVEALFAVHGKLPVNVKFLIEGEEEVGGESIARYVPEHKAKLKADVALISDTELFAEGIPTLYIALRGVIYLELEALGPARDLHSGMFGGAAPNAVYGLIELLAKAKDAGGRILIPGIYDDVSVPAEAELESWNRLPFSEREFLEKEIGSTELTGEADQSVLARVWARPTFEVHGIAGGFTGAGAKTVIPAKAVAKVSMRLVPNQQPQKVIASFRTWVERNTPRGIRTDIRILSANPPISVNPDHPAIHIAAETFGKMLNSQTVFIRSGGSIPIVGEFAEHLGIPSILMGFGLPDDGLHSPNEKFRISNYYTGIITVAHFLEKYGQASPQ
jgi:acetylornithine deacetylase/succinyl-diaminopimelate desuccinylase-like protein